MTKRNSSYCQSKIGFNLPLWRARLFSGAIDVHEKESLIPVFYGIDAIHRFNNIETATLYPQQIALVATWKPNLLEDLGKIKAYEAQASGILWNFSPVLDARRCLRWLYLAVEIGEDIHDVTQRVSHKSMKIKR